MNEGTELNELYKELTPEVRDELSRHEERVTVPAGTKLIRPRSTPEHLIFIEQGSVEISVPAGEKALCVNVVGSGKVLGLRPIVANAAPEIEATTLEDCTIVRIPREIFVSAVKHHPEMYFAISKVLSADLNHAERLLRDLPRSAKKDHNATV